MFYYSITAVQDEIKKVHKTAHKRDSALERWKHVYLFNIGYLIHPMLMLSDSQTMESTRRLAAGLYG
jgi:hypothetical protein